MGKSIHADPRGIDKYATTDESGESSKTMVLILATESQEIMKGL